jgi:hypothetical protein
MSSTRDVLVRLAMPTTPLNEVVSTLKLVLIKEFDEDFAKQERLSLFSSDPLLDAIVSPINDQEESLPNALLLSIST